MTKSVLNKDGSSSIELLQLVICQLYNEEFGIEISKVKEIIRIPDITKIPHAPVYVKGIINLRSSIIPIIDLSAKFGLAHEKMSTDSRIVVVEIGELVAGMIVDAVSEVLRISSENIESAPEVIVSQITGRYIQGVGKIDERLLILLDIDKIFTDEQKVQIGRLENAGYVPA
ncbi:chemotaxis protein CheW [Methanolobus vulcani]|uniref:Chemotaxis protein CheW n=1 Tax=Methanolobus vulcani TaxID=38026 RepID=A0A7Z8P193_9EURY|nr:chemotaxis protein CheW [Methanolobus vulcani]TQD23898.1 chemotaxis protein CheW [Methanolobus vulcani]